MRLIPGESDELPYDASFTCSECGQKLHQRTGPTLDGTLIDILWCPPCEIVYDIKNPTEEWPFPGKLRES